MIDFHNHIIPQIDDGAKNIEMGINMARYAHQNGTRCVINTVHLQHPTVKNASFDEIDKRKKDLELELKNNNIDLKIISASEIYFNGNLHELIDIPITTIANKYMLVEFNPQIMPLIIDQVFFQLKLKGIYPIIAHPERYRFVQNNLKLIKEWIQKDYFIQINSSSILGDFGRKAQQTSMKLIQNNNVHLIGSDAHNDSNRNFSLKQSLVKIKQRFGEDNIEILKKNLNNLIAGENLNQFKSKQKKRFWFF
jgi:protein-tyrosine phosphatase